MKQTTAHAAASTGSVGAAMIVLQYVLTTFAHVSVPVDVASAAIMLLTPLVHVLISHGTTGNPNEANTGA